MLVVFPDIVLVLLMVGDKYVQNPPTHLPVRKQDVNARVCTNPYVCPKVVRSWSVVGEVGRLMVTLRQT
jgi:hypothetical protein